MSKFQDLKDQLSSEFEMKDLRGVRILGMDILWDIAKDSLILSQNEYLVKVLKTFGMWECKAVSTLLGSQFKQQAIPEAKKL